MAFNFDKDQIVARRICKWSDAALEEVDYIIEKAAKGSDDDKYALADMMYMIRDRHPEASHAEQRAIYHQIIELCEELGKRGHMRACQMLTSIYMNGSHDMTYETTYEGTIIGRGKPDYYKAREWGYRAAALGSTWTNNIDERIAMDQEARNQRPGAPRPS